MSREIKVGDRVRVTAGGFAGEVFRLADVRYHDNKGHWFKRDVLELVQPAEEAEKADLMEKLNKHREEMAEFQRRLDEFSGEEEEG